MVCHQQRTHLPNADRRVARGRASVSYTHLDVYKRQVITHRPADDIAPELEKYRKEIGQYITQEEDVLTYALFPQVATKFFEYRQAQQLKLDNSLLDKENHVLPV